MKQQRAYVGSTNQLKIEAVQAALGDNVDVVGLKRFSSSVSEFPMGCLETFIGARARAKAAQAVGNGDELYFGIESGFIREEKEIDYFTANNADLHDPNKENYIEDSEFVVVCVVLLAKNGGAKLKEHVYWSQPLRVPITHQIRRDNITAVLQKLSKELFLS
eukprot:TRINITY_DN22313_c0_g1_i1.p1 TRINITY_DN22313_c0_g1~~TRINITY_DN22313_c0_g1_i1.p1  ORF type:complete len:162 (+),score=28.59 TRINITY_DN22313_c0_g1_i1:71-556(+)